MNNEQNPNDFKIIEKDSNQQPQYNEQPQFDENMPDKSEIPSEYKQEVKNSNLSEYQNNFEPLDDSIIVNNIETTPINKSNDQNNFQTIEEDNSYTFNESQGNENKIPIKKILIIIGAIVVIAGIVFLIYYLVNNSNKSSIYKEKLVTAAESYYQNVSGDLPTSYGECNTITLNELISSNLIDDNTLKNKCDNTNTTVKTCKLKNGTYHYTPTLNCNNKKLNTNYGDWILGNESDLEKNSDVKFLFSINATELPEDINSIPNEDYIEDEITFEKWTYEEINKKVVYHSRDQLYNWYTLTNHYYPTDTTVESKVNEYYTSAPNSTYKNKGNSATVYQWYIGMNLTYNNGAFVSEAVYPYTIKGTEGPAKVWATTDFPDTKSYRTITTGDIYRARKLESTDVLTNIDYHCINDSNGNKWTSHNANCDNELSTEVGTIRAFEYKCYWTNNKTNTTSQSETWQSDECSNRYYYENSNINEGYTTTWSATNCGYSATAKPYLCDKRTGYIVTDRVWKWYTPSTKEYYKSNDQKTYYKQSPSAQAVKDSTTEVVGYTWYKTVQNNLGAYKTSPSAGAIKGSKTWSEWSSWTETPITATETMEVEQKNMITLKRLITENTKWTAITNNYVSEEEAISILKEKGYKVNSIEDIFNAKNIKYEIELYYRNPK